MVSAVRREACKRFGVVGEWFAALRTLVITRQIDSESPRYTHGSALNPHSLHTKLETVEVHDQELVLLVQVSPP